MVRKKQWKKQKTDPEDSDESEIASAIRNTWIKNKKTLNLNATTLWTPNNEGYEFMGDESTHGSSQEAERIVPGGMKAK